MSAGNNSARDATLDRTGSHHISDDNASSRVGGISKEEVFFYFSAKWRGRPVQVEVSADKYAHSNGMSDWRVYARAARYYDPNKPDGRGETTTDTARSALGELCVPIAMEWLASDEYKASFQRALARMVMRKFDHSYSVPRDVDQALATFRDRLSPPVFKAITATLEAYKAYEVAKTAALEKIVVVAA